MWAATLVLLNVSGILEYGLWVMNYELWMFDNQGALLSSRLNVLWSRGKAGASHILPPLDLLIKNWPFLVGTPFIPHCYRFSGPYEPFGDPPGGRRGLRCLTCGEVRFLTYRPALYRNMYIFISLPYSMFLYLLVSGHCIFLLISNNVL